MTGSEPSKRSNTAMSVKSDGNHIVDIEFGFEYIVIIQL
jgi:hypothetical protein